jgi:ABC-type oligopeptide transport system substrate-binding subunit/tetratricopeptide (TPR) repeat protein
VVREKLEEGMCIAPGAGEGGQEGAHLIGRLIGFELGASRQMADLLDDAQQLRNRALMHLADYFRGMATQSPVLILLEDLHWADDSSLDVLNHLATALAAEQVMAICAARPALFERRPHWGEGQRFHSRLALEPLSRWDSRRLVAEILQKVEQVPETLRDLVVAGAEGNPFFIEELIKMLIEDGVIVTGEDRWRLEPSRLAEVRVPPTLIGVLQTRLDHLPTGERLVLQQASVVGRMFWDRAVACINAAAGEGIEETEILENLAALRGREMIFQRETSSFADAQEYVFKHNMLREITYEGVLKRRRRVYHGLVADWLLEQGGERAGEYTGLIAEHLALAGRAAEASDYLLQAGDRARDLYAHQEAIRAYERALALFLQQGDDERAARTLMKLGLTYHTAFDFRQARRAYEEGFALWQKAGKAQPAIPPPPAPHALRIGYGILLDLDPAGNTDSDTFQIIGHLFSGLVALTADMDLEPDVTRSWEVSEGGRRYLFHLRDDVRWSDGQPVTAADFEFAWKRMLDPARGSPIANLLYDVRGARDFHQGHAPDPDRVAIKALDDVTLLVELESPTGYFLQVLPSLVPAPRHTVQAWGRTWTEPGKLVTNGPFRLEERQSGERLVLGRNPTYHGRFAGNLQRVELCVLPHEAWPAKLHMYEMGDLDVLLTHWIPGAEMDKIRQRHSDEYVSVPEAALLYVAFDVSRPPFDDARVRQAFALATDRETLAGVAYGGYHFPATGGAIPPGIPGHSPGMALPYDPDRARQLLAEAGYPDGRGFPAVDLPLCPGTLLRGEYLLPQWQESLQVPVTSNRSLDWPAYLQMLNSEPPHLWVAAWAADYPDPDNFLRMGLSWHRSRWKNDDFFKLLEEARHLTEQRERIRLYRQADRIVVEQAAVLPLIYPRTQLLVQPWVKKLPTSPFKTWFWQDVVIEAH